MATDAISLKLLIIGDSGTGKSRYLKVLKSSFLLFISLAPKLIAQVY